MDHSIDADKVVATLDRLALERGAPAFVRFDHEPQFDSQLKARVLIEDWRIDYNEHRPHSAHGELTPSEFAKAWTTRYQPALA